MRQNHLIPTDRVIELLSNERQLFAIADAWEKYKQARDGTTDGVNEFVILALILDAIAKEDT